jgi:hypothetical protein
MNLKIGFISLLLLSCSQVKIKDSEWCGDAGPYGASCFKTLSDNSRDIEKEEWDKERFGMICTKAENFAEWKIAILKLCKMAGRRCKYDVKQKVIRFNEKVEAFSKSLEFVAIDEND